MDGISLHEILLSEGLAAVRYVNKPNDTLENELLEIQQQAEQKKLNIWHMPTIYPEELRK